MTEILHILLWLLLIVSSIHLVLTGILWYSSLFDKVPKGETKEWIFTLWGMSGIAVTFTNNDGKHGTWHIGFFKISKK